MKKTLLIVIAASLALVAMGCATPEQGDTTNPATTAGADTTATDTE